MDYNQKNLVELTKVIAQNPDDTTALAHRSEFYQLKKHYKEALADLNQIIQLKPNHTWAIAHRGVVYRRMKCNKKALTDLNQAINLKPDYVWALIHRANIYTMEKRYDAALVDVDKALTIDKTIIPHWPGERGLLLSYMGRYSEAMVCCEQGLKDDPYDYVTLYTLTVVKAHQFGLEQANLDKTRSAVQAMLHTKERAGALYRLGGLAALEEHIEPALNYLQQAIAIDNNEPRGLAHHDLAWHKLRDNPRFQSLLAEENAFET